MKHQRKKIAIVMATYNGGHFLKEQIESIRKQKYTNWKLIIRDDLSNDTNTKDIIKNYSINDKRITLLKSQGHIGVKESFLVLLKYCYSKKFDYIFLSDQDDIWESNKISKFLESFRLNESQINNTPQLIFSDITLIDNHSNHLKKIIFSRSEKKIFKNLDLPKLIFSNYIPGMAMAINKSLLDNLFTKPINFRHFMMHDWLLAMLAACTGKIFFIDSKLVRYRIHQNNLIGLNEGRIYERLLSHKRGIYSCFQQINSFYLNFLPLISGEHKNFIRSLLKIYSFNTFSRIIFYFQNNISKRNLLSSFLLFFVIVLKKNFFPQIKQRGKFITIFTHYFPPENSSGSMRIVSFVDYLHKQGYFVNVITSKKHLISEGIPKSVNNRNDFNYLPRNISRKSQLIFKKIKYLLTPFFGQILDVRISNFVSFIFLSKTNRNIIMSSDLIIASYPPWPYMFFAYLMSKKFDLPFIADYRDIFSGHHNLSSKYFLSGLEKKIDSLFARHARFISVVSSPMKEYYDWLSLKPYKVHIIPNGFDNKIYATKRLFLDHKIIKISYLGSLNSLVYGDQPPIIFEVLASLPKDLLLKINFTFYGENHNLKNYIAHTYPDLLKCVTFYPLVSHKISLSIIRSSDFVYFYKIDSEKTFSERSILTTKIFEYISLKTPIIAEAPKNSLVSHILNSSGVCIFCNNDKKKLHSFLTNLFSRNNFKINYKPNNKFINTFKRDNILKKTYLTLIRQQLS